MSQNATLVIDFGNSETRGAVMFGKEPPKNKFIEKGFTLSNRFAEIPHDYTPSTDYTEESSTILDIKATVNSVPFVGRFANGELQQKEFAVAPLRPSATEKKHASSTTALSYALAMLYAHKEIAKATGIEDVEAVDVTWSVVILLPPGDIDAGKNKIVEMVKSIKTIKFDMPEVTLNISMSNVSVLPEGFCAYIATVFDRGNVLRPEMKDLLKEVTLVFDVGAGTTDIMVFKDNKHISSSMHTIDRGGNNVTQLVKKAIRKNHNGLRVTDSDLFDGVLSGFIKDGSKTVSIIEYVDEAKQEIARYLIEDVKSYLEETEIPLRSISKILVCGGGSITTDSGSKPLSLSIIEYLKRLSPYVELVQIPTHTVLRPNEDGVLERVKEKISPRDLNIIGATIMAEML